jgi:D-alanine-D-alanine ligase
MVAVMADSAESSGNVHGHGDTGRLRVAVIFGGRSSEHAISCVSAAGVIGALQAGGYEVVPVGITPEGRWVVTSGDRAELEIKDRTLPAVKDGTEVVLSADPTVGGLIALDPWQGRAEVVEPSHGAQQLARVDVVFPILHGAYGEDGSVQGLLEMAGVPYVGAGILSSAVGMDKEFTKRLLLQAGLPVGPYTVLRPGQNISAQDIQRLGFPMFVKPARGGSSLGVSKVSAPHELIEAIARAREIDPKILIESAIIGREIECGVLQSETPGGLPDTSLPAEVRVISGSYWYDFDAKYLDDACEFDIPPDLPKETITQIQELARQTFLTLDVAGLARVDFFLSNNGEIFINEINTLPGFTPKSVFPLVWEASGISYQDLVSRLVRTAHANGIGLR